MVRTRVKVGPAFTHGVGTGGVDRSKTGTTLEKHQVTHTATAVCSYKERSLAIQAFSVCVLHGLCGWSRVGGIANHAFSYIGLNQHYFGTESRVMSLDDHRVGSIHCQHGTHIHLLDRVTTSILYVPSVLILVKHPVFSSFLMRSFVTCGNPI